MPSHRLVLIRHAKAAEGSVDAERPLTGRGTRQAAAIGAWLAKAGLVPDRVAVSSARRAAQTWSGAAEQLEGAPPPTVDGRIYDNTVEALLAVLQETPEDARTVAVVGHNPSIAELTHALDDGQGDPAARRAAEDGFPTGCLVVFELTTPFEELEAGTATLTAFAVP
jgi:phosphohistidine phosphatase